MATFVIAHGAFGGGWSWSRVRPLLRAAGHEVFTPTSTGLGEHYFVAAPQGLPLRVDDVLTTYVLIDPCNPPTNLGFTWSGPTGQVYGAYWGASNRQWNRTGWTHLGPGGAPSPRGSPDGNPQNR